jgi:signal transduction histidine kinase
LFDGHIIRDSTIERGEPGVSTPKDQLVASITSARSELDQALAVLEELPALDPRTVGYAAHAMNNYLGIANATLDLLIESLAIHPNAEVWTRLSALKQTTSLMGHTINQLLNASAVGEPKFILGNVNLVKLVQIACEYYQARAERKRIHLTFESQLAAAYVWSDRVAVAAVLDNLLSNAVKFSKPGSQVRAVVTEEPNHFVCQVCDQGPGLSAEDQAGLFQRGVKLSAQPTGGEASSGFGLAIAKDLIEGLGGKIWCESALGQGACFSFSLPIKNN